MKLAAPLYLVAVLGSLMVAGCDTPQRPAATVSPGQAQAPIDAAETIYAGGDIVTMNDEQASAEALAVKGGRIIAVGSRADLTDFACHVLLGGAAPTGQRRQHHCRHCQILSLHLMSSILG